MKMFSTTILLCAAIVLIVFGMHTNTIIPSVIGGFLAGVYNAIIYYKQD